MGDKQRCTKDPEYVTQELCKFHSNANFKLGIFSC